MRRGLLPNALFHTRHQDFVLLLAEIQKYSLGFQEVRHALPGHVTENRGGRVMRVRPLLPQDMHHVRILPHGEVQKGAGRGEEALNPLLPPARQSGNKGWLPGMSPGGLGLYMCLHKTPQVCCIAAYELTIRPAATCVKLYGSFLCVATIDQIERSLPPTPMATEPP